MPIKSILKSLIIVAMLFTLTSCVSGGIDRGNLGTMERSLNTRSYGYQVIDDYTGGAPTAKIERFEVRPGDCGSVDGWSDCSTDRERSELMEPKSMRSTRSGSQYWYGWSVYFPKEHPNINPAKVAFGQFHQDSSNDPLILFFQYKDGLYVEAQVNGSKELLIPEDELRGKWHNIEIFAKWSKEWSEGKFQVWVNGELKADITGYTCRNNIIYFKYGIYRSYLSRYERLKSTPDEAPAQTVFYSNVRRAKTRDGLLPASN